MYFEDLSPAPFLRARSPVLAIGWLERGRPFPTGPVEAAFFRKLMELRRDRWLPFASAGLHPCDLCQFDAEAKGGQMLFVPGDAAIYCCPDLIVHYINAHAYQPPAEFVEAVEACPASTSLDFKKRLVTHGVTLAD